MENFRPDAAEILTRGSRRRSRMILNKGLPRRELLALETPLHLQPFFGELSDEIEHRLMDLISDI
jgi:hypothetical protein